MPDAVVGGYRLGRGGDELVSLLLGMYDEQGELHFVGHCSSFSARQRSELLQQFQRLPAERSFGENARRPEIENRCAHTRGTTWVPVIGAVVVEVSYDQVTNGRFRHATRFERWRPDKEPRSCTLDQLA